MNARAIATATLACASALTFVACDSAGEEPADDTQVATSPDVADTTTPDDTATTAPDDTTTTPDDTATTAPDDTSTTPDTTTGDTTTAQPGPTYTLQLGGWTMKPQEETTRCVIKRLDNDEPILVHRISTSLSKGSHHLIVYTSAAEQEQAEPFECSPFTETLGGSSAPLVISQIRRDEVVLPDNVAYELKPHQMIRLEAHYLDYFPEDITAEVEVTFETIVDSPAVQRADLLFYGTLSVYLPKDDHEVQTPWKFYTVPDGLHFFAMTGHTHALGTNVEVARATSASDEGTSVYPPEGKPFDWQEAPVARWEPSFQLDANEGFRFRCTWDNTTGHDVFFGESATSEMCFFWAYYYPSQGPIIRF